MINKRLIVVIASVLCIAVATTLAIVLIKPGEDVPQSSQSSASGISGSQSSGGDEVELPAIIERTPFMETVSSNVTEATLARVYAVYNGEEKVLPLIFENVVFGDVAKAMLGQLLHFDYREDGNWYMGTGIRFQAVTNAIFNYEIGGEPLALNQTELSLFGETTIISCFESQFNIKFSTILNAIASSSSSAQIFTSLFEMKVKDFYDLTCGNYGYITQTVEQTEIDDVITLAFEVLKLLDIDSKFPSGLNINEIGVILGDLLDGTVAQYYVDPEYMVADLIDGLQAALPSEGTFTEVTFYRQLKQLYANVPVTDLIVATEQLTVQSVTAFFKSVLNALAMETDDAQLSASVGEWSDIINAVVSGTLKQPQFSEQSSDYVALTEKLLGVITKQEDNLASATKLVETVSEIKSVIEQINQSVQNVEQVVNDFIVNTLGLTESDVEAIKEVGEFALMVAQVKNGNEQAFDIWLSANGCSTLSDIDLLFGGKLSDLLKQTGIFSETLMALTVNDVVNDVRLYEQSKAQFIKVMYQRYVAPEMEKDAQLSLEEFDNARFGGAISKIVPEKLKYLLGAKVGTFKQLLDFVFERVSPTPPQEPEKEGLLDVSLLIYDLLITGGKVDDMFSDHDVEDLLKYSINDYISLLNKQIDQDHLDTLEEITVGQLLDALKEVKNARN